MINNSKKNRNKNLAMGQTDCISIHVLKYVIINQMLTNGIFF